MDDKKKPRNDLNSIDPKAESERLKAHLKLIDDLASGAAKKEGDETGPPLKSDDEA